jgi:uncharacterized protein (TIGR03437 family)
MLRCCATVLAVFCSVSGGLSQEVITGPPVPQTTYYPDVLPMGGISRGGMFASFGENYTLGDTLVDSEFPLEGLLGETAAEFMVEGKTIDANLVFVAPSQLAGVYPSDGPTGQGQYRVVRGGMASPWVPVRIEDVSPGFFTLSQTGQGYGIFSNLDFELISPVVSFKVGETGIAWTGGLGARNSDAVPSPQSLPTDDMRFILGGVEADIVGASPSGCCVAVDQVAFTINAGTPTGCFVPAWMEMTVNGDQRISNVSTVSIVPADSNTRVCSDTHSFGAEQVQDLADKDSFTVVSLQASRVWNRTLELPDQVITSFEGPRGGFTLSANEYSYDDWWRRGRPFAAGSCGLDLGSDPAFTLHDPTRIPVNAEGEVTFFPEEGNALVGSIFQSPDGQTSGHFMPHPMFGDRRIRRAVVTAIDMNAILMTPDVPQPTIWELDPFGDLQYALDPVAALLEEAGWGGGIPDGDEPIEFSIPADANQLRQIQLEFLPLLEEPSQDAALADFRYKVTCYSQPGEGSISIPNEFFELAPIDPYAGNYLIRTFPSKVDKLTEGEPGDFFINFRDDFFTGEVTSVKD